MTSTEKSVKMQQSKITTEVKNKPIALIDNETTEIEGADVSKKTSKFQGLVITGLMNVKYSISTALLIAKKEILMILRYPWEILFWTLMPLMWLIPFVFQGQALVGTELQSENFAQLAGTTNVLEFIFIGALLWNILDSAIWGAGNALRWEQHSGTLQYLWLAPISRINLMIGASLGSTVWALIEIIGQFAVLSIFVSWQITFLDAFMTLIILILVIIGLYGFSFAFAGVILVFKEPGVLTEFVDSALYICSPIRYPLNVLPNWAKWIGLVVPFSWGLMAIRALLMTNDSIISMLYMVGILIGIDIIFWLGGYLLFRLAERKTLKKGDLGAF
ncbi:MAG: ABC transporter permease [Candidatus Heimdallarchaeota archaeon]